MPRPGDNLSRVITREDGATGVGVAGLVTADFTVTAYRNGAVVSLTKAFTSLGSGKYKFDYTLPSQTGIIDIFIVPATGSNVIWPGQFSEHVATQDLDSIASVNRPTAVLAATTAVGSEFPIDVFDDTYNPIEWTITEADRVTLVDLTGWNNFKFGVQNDDQSVEGGYLPYQQTTGITGDASGNLAVVIPDAAAFYAALRAADLPQRVLWYTASGDQASDAAKTRVLAWGKITVRRRETT